MRFRVAPIADRNERSDAERRTTVGRGIEVIGSGDEVGGHRCVSVLDGANERAFRAALVAMAMKESDHTMVAVCCGPVDGVGRAVCMHPCVQKLDDVEMAVSGRAVHGVGRPAPLPVEWRNSTTSR